MDKDGKLLIKSYIWGVHIDDEVTIRTATASVAFDRFPGNVWEQNGIRLGTKLKVYKAVLLPNLLYACGHGQYEECQMSDYQRYFYGKLQEGKRSQGGLKKRYKDTHKASLNDFNIPTESWEQAAQDRAKWRQLIWKGAAQKEEKSVKLKGRVKNAKPEPTDHHQSRYSHGSLALLAIE